MTSNASDQLSQALNSEAVSSHWKVLFRVGGIIAIAVLVLTIAQMVVFLAWPPPDTVEGFFTIFQSSWLQGLLSLDLIYIVINTLLILIYFVLYIALKRNNEPAATVALVLGLVGIAAYFSSNPAFQMLSLSGQYTAAATDIQRSVYLGAGEAMLATYSGTAFDMYYILNAITLLIFSVVMLRSHLFMRAMAYLGIASGVLMLIPSTAGTIGLYFSLFSIIPWTIWLILLIPRLFRLGSDSSKIAADRN